jgi:membrane protein YqaA with SNARE-associated domain
LTRSANPGDSQLQIFSRLYDQVLGWAKNKYAPYYLGGLSFAESSFFPIPPDVMLVPMVLADRKRAWFYAGLVTITSVLGGLAGYGIGFFAFEFISPVLKSAGYWQDYMLARDWFDRWGLWVIFIAGFSPVPYKIFTIGAGTVSLALFPFVMASLFGRGARFFLVAGLVYAGGEKMEQMLRRYIDILGWVVVVLLVAAYFIFS